MSQDIRFDDKTSQQLCVLGVRATIVAENLPDAERVLEEETVNLALLDVNLPSGETTLQLGQRLSESGVPVVSFSGFDADEMAQLWKGHEFLEKP